MAFSVVVAPNGFPVVEAVNGFPVTITTGAQRGIPIRLAVDERGFPVSFVNLDSPFTSGIPGADNFSLPANSGLIAGLTL